MRRSSTNDDVQLYDDVQLHDDVQQHDDVPLSRVAVFVGQIPDVFGGKERTVASALSAADLPCSL